MGLIAPDKFSSETKCIEFSENDKLYLYTDGVTEIKNPTVNECFGVDRIIKVIESCKNNKNTVQSIVKEAMSFAKISQQVDDITLAEVILNG